MDEDKNRDSGSLKRRHFRKLHEKIQNKYNQMKMKLDKSRSMSSLTSLADDYSYKDPKFSSQLDIRSVDEEFGGDDTSSMGTRKIVEYSVIEEAVNLSNAKLQDIGCDEAIHFTYVDNENDNVFFRDHFRTSIESLNEEFETFIELESQPPTPSTKISIRDKIGSRIAAAKEKRRRDEKEKNANRDKRKDPEDRVEKYILSNSIQDIVKKKQKVATLTVALIKATLPESESPSEEKPRHCRLRLGTEKRKSKTVKSNASEVNWQELFNLNMYDEQNVLEITFWENNMVGRSLVDLAEVDKEKTHKMTLEMTVGANGGVQLFILLTISGTTSPNTFVDLEDYHDIHERQQYIESKYAWYNLRNKFRDVGWLSVIIYGAKGLPANECYCVVELENERLQTLTDYKTNEPNWMKIFNFAVSDATSILEMSVFDERRSDDVGKLSIPLLRINNGEKKWYALKDSSKRDRAKGSNPRILLEMKFTWNVVKASVRVINPKEIKYLKSVPKFYRHELSKNWSRAKVVWNWSRDVFKVTKTCFEWESRKLNIAALTVWLLFWWFFKAWMLPLLLLIPFVWYRPDEYFIFPSWKRFIVKKYLPNEELEEKEEKSTSLRQKINSLQEIVQTVQNTLGKLASLGESVKNLFNFSVPFLSFLTIFFIVVITYIVYLIPVNYILMIWGLQKFARKILRPNRIPNSEILDLLSRVPDDETLLGCEHLPLHDLPDDDA